MLASIVKVVTEIAAYLGYVASRVFYLRKLVMHRVFKLCDIWSKYEILTSPVNFEHLLINCKNICPVDISRVSGVSFSMQAFSKNCNDASSSILPRARNWQVVQSLLACRRARNWHVLPRKKQRQIVHERNHICRPAWCAGDEISTQKNARSIRNSGSESHRVDVPCLAGSSIQIHVLIRVELQVVSCLPCSVKGHLTRFPSQYLASNAIPTSADKSYVRREWHSNSISSWPYQASRLWAIVRLGGILSLGPISNFKIPGPQCEGLETLSGFQSCFGTATSVLLT
jgi:hypothetical protein